MSKYEKTVIWLLLLIADGILTLITKDHDPYNSYGDRLKDAWNDYYNM